MHKAQLLKYLLDIRASYWFIPSIMVVVAIFLSLATVWLDGQLSSDWPEKVPFLFANKPDGARALLATVAGSMITVAGVTFSLTLLAVSHATAQFGPRLLNNFMRDRGNQITLGTFVATFIYCLLVLRTVRAADEQPHGKEVVEDLVAAFVPHISLAMAMVMTLCSVGVLIYFIHHVPESIRLSNVVSNVGKQLARSIDEIFPEMIAHRSPDDSMPDPRKHLPDDFFDRAVSVSLDYSGYVQSVNESGVMEAARDLDAVIYLKHRPGDFYCGGMDLLLISPGEGIDDEARERLQALFAMGSHRTMSQNVMFAVDQLVEVAQRALSPGVNDPMTATYCMDWLQASLVELTKRDPPDVFRFDDDENLRVFTRPLLFEDFCDRMFDQLRQYVAADRNATFHMMHVIKNVRESAHTDRQREVMDYHANRLIETVATSGFPDFDLAELKEVDYVQDADHRLWKDCVS